MMGYEDIQPSVIIVIGESNRSRIGMPQHSRSNSHIRECAVAIVLKKLTAWSRVVTEVEIRVSVVIVIPRSNTFRTASKNNPGTNSNIQK